MSDEPTENKTERVQLLMTPSEVEAIDDWGFKNRIRTRAEAIRRLCQYGLVYDREVRAAVDMVIATIVNSHSRERPGLSKEERDALYHTMAISLFNAGTVTQKLAIDSTDEAVKELLDLYAYYEQEEKKGRP